jgi:hypothetical protein
MLPVRWAWSWAGWVSRVRAFLPGLVIRRQVPRSWEGAR